MTSRDTVKYSTQCTLKKHEKEEILFFVYSALKEKGYNPVNQLVGYLMSGDPTYVTTFQDARNQVKKLERDDILEILIESYFDKGRRE